MAEGFAEGLKSLTFYVASILKQAGANPVVKDILDGRVDLDSLDMPVQYREVMKGQFNLLKSLLENTANAIPGASFDGRVLKIGNRTFDLTNLTIDEFYRAL